MNNNKLCTVLVNSCDEYEDAWVPFFKLLKKYWKNIQYPIVLNTETKVYKDDELNIKTTNLSNKSKSQKTTWSSRMIETLKKIDSQYIIFFLEDFFLMDYVDNKKINQVIDWMEDDENIGVFSFNIVEDNQYNDIISKKYPCYKLRNKKGPYRFNCQAAIWRKEVLIKTFRKHENAWEWELIGNRRSRRFKEKFYTLCDKKDMIFKYDCENVGIVRGKWRMPDTKDFFEKENIKINFSIRNSKERKIKSKNKYLSKIKLYYTKIKSLR